MTRSLFNFGCLQPDQLNQQCSSSNYSGSHERPHPKHGRRSGSKSAAAANLAESDRQSVVMGDHMGVVSIDYEAGRTGLYCEVCQVQLNSSDQCNIHYRGVRHIRKAKVVRMRESKWASVGSACWVGWPSFPLGCFSCAMDGNCLSLR